MLTLQLQNVFKVGTAHGLVEAEFNAFADSLPHHLAGFRKRGQVFHEVIDDVKVVKAIKAFAAQRKGTYRHIVVLGIGGSALGTICVQQALTHLYGNELKKRNVPTLHVLDNIDPALMTEITDAIDLKKTLFLVISKSGSSPETLAQYFYVRALLEKKKLKVKDRVVFITDPKNGFLRQTADRDGIVTLDHPTVGGRFSVLTVVGLLPAAFLGVNIEELLRGARDMRDHFVSENFSSNLSYQLAAVQYALYHKGKPMVVMMPYAQKLFRLADWYRQLLAESIGKAKNDAGQPVHVGFTPVNALGVTDQHSQSQLYNEGPNDKLIMFVEVGELGKRLPIPLPKKETARDVAFLRGVTFNQLIQTEKDATADAYTESGHPNLTIKIPKIDAYHLGQLFMLLEGSVAFLGEFFKVNAYDQPGVERAKVLTKEYLLRK